MAIKPVLRMGDPRLLEQSQPVRQFGTPELRELIADMQDTMRALDGAGLAAPQIGIGLQVVIFGVESNPRYPDAEPVPATVFSVKRPNGSRNGSKCGLPTSAVR